MRRLWQCLFGHPLIKAVTLGVFALLGNVFAGAYVFEITKSKPKLGQFLDWSATPHSRSFWALVSVLVATGLYSWGIARYEKLRVGKLLTQADIQSHVIEELLGPLIENARKDIRDGKVRTLSDVMATFQLNDPRPK